MTSMAGRGPILVPATWRLGEDIVVAGRGMVVFDHREDVKDKRPQVVDAPADARLTVGMVAGHRGSRQGQRRGGVVVSATAQAGPAAVAVRLVVGHVAAIN